jgi:2-keto-4-pentenoate hydratase
MVCSKRDEIGRSSEKRCSAGWKMVRGVIAEPIVRAAARLREAQRERRPIAPLSREWAGLDERAAYAIQFENVAASGEPVVGFKLGYTSAAMRAQMKIDSPNYGALLASTRVAEDGFIDSSELIHPLIEPEIAFILSKKISDDSLGFEDVSAAVGAVLPALEIVDTRYESYVFGAYDNIADNSSAARFVLGPPRTLAALGDLRELSGALWCNGRTLGRGVGADVLGHPLAALAWFLQRRVRDGFAVPAGSVILTGGMTAAQAAPAGSAFVAEFGSLGIAKCYFGSPA